VYSVKTVAVTPTEKRGRQYATPEAKEQDRIRQAKYRAAKRYDYSGASKRSQHMKRVRALMLLGGKCENCGNNDMRVLDFDHVKNNGAEHRRQGFIGHKMIKAVLQNPTDYQVLCSNCNRIKYFESKGY